MITHFWNDVLKVSDVNELFSEPVSTDNTINYYEHDEKLFDIMHDLYLSIGHGCGGRNRMEYELIAKYKNIIWYMIMT